MQFTNSFDDSFTTNLYCHHVTQAWQSKRGTVSLTIEKCPCSDFEMISVIIMQSLTFFIQFFTVTCMNLRIFKNMDGIFKLRI